MKYVNYVSEKICTECKILQPITNFSTTKDHKDDVVFRNVCKKCIACRNHLRYLKNQDKINSYRETSEYKESKKIWDKTYKETHGDDIKKRKKNYYQENKEEIASKNAEYQKNNRHIRNNNEKNKKRNNPVYNLKTLVSSRISSALKNAGTSKKDTTFTKYVPYSMQELKTHLEKQFEPWMTWENWGKYNKDTWIDNDPTTWTWQIDHIIPRSSLPYATMEDDNFKKCWALENLRPLSAKQNIIDGSQKTRHK